jgi:RNA polymerase sigma-70 factor, ECF subfamily
MEPANAALEAPPIRARSHDADADATQVAELFRGCELRLGKFLAQMVSDRSLAEDLLQDTFHDAFRARHQLDSVESAEAWLFGIARNRALNALRRRRRFRVAVSRLIRPPAQTETDDLDLLALRDLLERHLEPEERALLLLRYLHGFQAAELGAMTNRTPEAVRQRLSRTRAKLMAAAEQHPGPWPPSTGARKETER